MLVGSLTELLGSPSSVAQEWAFDFVGSLARHEFIESAVLEPLCVRLLSLLWGEDLKVATRATRALYKICHWSKGARAVVAGKGFYEVERLLRSLNLEVREWSCWFLGRLACCEGILDPGLCVRLVRSLSIYNDDLDVIMALSALRKISFCFDGAQATVNANVLDHVGKLLASCNADIRQYSCSLVKTLAEKGFLPSGVHRKLVENLLSLLRGNENAIFIWLAIYALQEISQWADGAVAVAEANALGYI
ncbi:armadillo-type protein [Mycena galericulata]|nr:armadillo-type protein [Mycena galericulata]